MISTITVQLTLIQLIGVSIAGCTIGLFFGMLLCKETNKVHISEEHDEDSNDEDQST